MKKFMLTLISCFCFISSTQASFEDSWCTAVENCESKNFEQAEINFSEAISEMEILNDDSKPHVYVDRGRLYMLLKRYEEAILDLNKALESPKLIQQDRIRGLVSKIITCGNLGLESKNELKELKELYPNFPKIEFTEKRVIIRNVPDCECYKGIVKAYFTSSGICDSENDINMMKSGTCIIKKKSKGCSCKENKKNKTLDFSSSGDRIENCQFWCSKLAKLGDAWCGNHFKNIPCQISCLAAVEVITAGCNWCCSGGNFHSKCIEPFNDILAKMDSKICAPDWD